jgi:nitrite reductase (NADH) large subunit
MPKQRLVIVGNGMAAARAIEAVLQRGGDELFQLAVFGEEPCTSYDRMLLADVMNGGRSIGQILHDPARAYPARGIRVHEGERAVLVSRHSRTVYGSAGTEERYDALIFATGSSPHFPPIANLFNAAGRRLPGVCDFRTLADCVQIIALANGARNIAVLGGGLLGLEAARGLSGVDAGAGAGQRRQVELIHRGARLMKEQLDEQAANHLQRRVESLGIRVRLNVGVKALVGEERVTGLVLTDGTHVACDLVVVATGLIPNTWLAFQCGLAVERGIAVDNQLRTVEDRRVFALGECAQHRSRVYSSAAAIREQAEVLAAQLTGMTPSPSFVGFHRSSLVRVMGLELEALGLSEAPGRVEAQSLSHSVG